MFISANKSNIIQQLITDKIAKNKLCWYKET